MKKLMFAAAVLAFTGITALNAKVYTGETAKIGLQDTTKKDTAAVSVEKRSDTTTTTTTTTDTTTIDTTTTPKQ